MGCEDNYWVRYRIAMSNHKDPRRARWKETSLCTRTWNNSVLQFVKTADVLSPDLGFMARDTVEILCQVLDVCPWFEFGELALHGSDEEDMVSSEAAEYFVSEESEGSPDVAAEEQDLFRAILAQVGYSVSNGETYPP